MEGDQKKSSAMPFEQKLFKPLVIVSLIVALLVACMPLLGDPGVANPRVAGAGGLWINFLGHFHPLLLHLPIGVLMLVFFMEALSLVTRGRYKARTTLALAFAAVSAVLAAVLGYFWYLTGDYNGETIEEHKRDGLIFTVLVIFTFIGKYSADVKAWSLGRISYFPLLGCTGIMMVSAGHHGGEISHGDLMAQFPTKILADRESMSDASGDFDPLIYRHIVHPILEDKCISCHGKDKQKGDLRMDSLAHMLDGGAEEECLVPGKPKDSFLLTSLDLPMEHDLHMPPEDKPQITPEEKLILTWWVQQGAPVELRLSKVGEVPAEIRAAIETLSTAKEAQ